MTETCDWQGAEARVKIIDYFGRRAILKQRFRKCYRHPQLDQKLLTRRITQALRSGVECPALYFVDPEEGTIIMEYVESVTAKQVINEDLLLRKVVAEQIGVLIAASHCSDLIHGDLTTSNIIFRRAAGNVAVSPEAVLIDFGLAQVSNLVEDKAVDLYVLERALLSTHPGSQELFDMILDTYARYPQNTDARSVLAKLAEVQMRGRKRSMVG